MLVSRSREGDKSGQGLSLSTDFFHMNNLQWKKVQSVILACPTTSYIAHG